mgnify:CR=1 FL=1
MAGRLTSQTGSLRKASLGQGGRRRGGMLFHGAGNDVQCRALGWLVGGTDKVQWRERAGRPHRLKPAMRAGPETFVRGLPGGAAA